MRTLSSLNRKALSRVKGPAMKQIKAQPMPKVSRRGK